jgi:inosine-uridine nucleoside N-ribohydrolase
MRIVETHFLLILFSLPTTIYGSPVSTILDTDIGTAYDDQLALTYILSREDLFHLKLIICSTSNTTARAQIVAKTLSIFKRFDIPIAIGRNTTDENNIFEYEWARDYSLEKFQNDGGTIFLDGEQSLIDEMNKASANNIYHYIQIGPATSLGPVLQKQPSLSLYIRLFAMAGSLYRGYGNSDTPSREYNVEVNIQSAQIMFSSQWAYFGLAPLDCTNFMQFNGLIWQNFLSYINTSSIVRMIIDSYTIWYNNGGKDMGSILPYSPQLGTPEMHDILAVYLAGSYPSVSPTVSALVPLFVTEDGFTRENQTIGLLVNSCLKYQTSDPYISTARIGSAVLESITKGSEVTGAAHRLIPYLQVLAILY